MLLPINLRRSSLLYPACPYHVKPQMSAIPGLRQKRNSQQSNASDKKHDDQHNICATALRETVCDSASRASLAAPIDVLRLVRLIGSGIKRLLRLIALSRLHRWYSSYGGATRTASLAASGAGEIPQPAVGTIPVMIAHHIHSLSSGALSGIGSSETDGYGRY